MRQINTVLLMRVVAHAELHNTRNAPDQLRAAFPGARLAALGAAGCEDTAILAADPRLDDLLLMPAHTAQSPRAFRQFMAGQSCDATVMCCGSTPGVNYPKQILASLLCPGKKFFLDAAGRLFPALSVAGLRVILSAVANLAAKAWLRFVMVMIVTSLRLAARLAPGSAAGGAGLPDAKQVKRLLYIRLDHIGDVAMSLPPIHALRRQYPDARIDILVLPSVAPVLADVSDIDEVITYAAPVFTRGSRPAGLAETLALLCRLRCARYDVAIDLRGNDLCRLLAFFSGARRRLGPRRSPYELSGRANYDFLLTHPVDTPPGPANAVDRCFETLRSCGLSVPEEHYRLPVADARREGVREKLADLGVERGYAVIHARPSEESREWSRERFSAAADYLAQEHGLTVLLTGAPRDDAYNTAIAAQCQWPDQVINVAGQFSLPELPALFADAAVMISVDTGPVHIAAMVGTPVVSLFHPGLARLHSPYGQADGVLVPQIDADLSYNGSEPSLLAAIALEDVLAMTDRKLQTSAKISLRLVSNSSDVISPSSSSPLSSSSRSLRERVADAA